MKLLLQGLRPAPLVGAAVVIVIWGLCALAKDAPISIGDPVSIGSWSLVGFNALAIKGYVLGCLSAGFGVAALLLFLAAGPGRSLFAITALALMLGVGAAALIEISNYQPAPGVDHALAGQMRLQIGLAIALLAFAASIRRPPTLA